MSGETNLSVLLRSMRPVLNEGDYVFCSVNDASKIDLHDAIAMFKEKEGLTVIIKKELAYNLHLHYAFIGAWITLTVHSSLDAVGLTAAFSTALSAQGISCNVVAAYYHDHIFVATKDADKAMKILADLSKN